MAGAVIYSVHMTAPTTAPTAPPLTGLAAFAARLIARLDLDCVAAGIVIDDARRARLLGIEAPNRRTGADRRAYRAAVRTEADRRRAQRRAGI